MPLKALRFFNLCWVALLAGCATPHTHDSDRLTSPFRVGISGDYPPFCLRASDPAASLGYQGFDLDLLQRLTRDLDLPQAQPVQFQWPNLAQTLAGNRVDLAVCGITVRPDRARAMIFTRPYAVSGAVAVLPRRDVARFKTLADLDQPGVRLGANTSMPVAIWNGSPAPIFLGPSSKAPATIWNCVACWKPGASMP
ncbi:transporter substrate-binding domain-containing protein [Methylomagnum ishizawai]|nr:transporter substrate-binding domain-containing protein [Methylomagnum ishizawai]